MRTKKKAAADAMLIAGLTSEDIAKIQEYIKIEQHENRIEEVEVTTNEGEVLAVGAHVYVWSSNMKLLEATSWTSIEYMGSRLQSPEDQEQHQIVGLSARSKSVKNYF